MNTALIPITTPAAYSGPLRDCLARFPESQRNEQTRRWYRAQMRGWAGYWRRRSLIAAMVGRPVQEVAETDLHLAKSYRDQSLKFHPRQIGNTDADLKLATRGHSARPAINATVSFSV